jgi:endoglucanase
MLEMQGTVAEVKSTDPYVQNQRLGRGVNILGYDPVWESRAVGRFKTEYFSKLKDAGFDSVRINLHLYRHMKDDGAWTLTDAWFNTLDWAVNNATSNGLMVILDLHEFLVMNEDPEGNHDKFLAAWRQLAAHYREAPDQVMFEILNEPANKMTPDLWNRYLREALAIIRASNPIRTVIVGPPSSNDIDHLFELDLPKEERNLIVTVHSYTPMQFTHQGASWSSVKDLSGIEWLGTEAERKAMRDNFATAANWARAHDRPIFLGEFGAYDKAPLASRIRWTDAVARTAESLGWSWAYWQFDSDFILYDIERDAWVEPIRDALIPSTGKASQPGNGK